VGALVLDASAVIALFSAPDAHHARAVTEFRAATERDDSFAMPASAYSEILVHSLREGREDLLDSFVDRLGIEVVPVDRELARLAAGCRAEHRALRLPDALVLALARASGARLLTFDERLAALQ
jgi:predicted nucleic acid-binding protein